MFNLTPHTIDGWNDLTDRIELPDGTLERFIQLHPEIRTDRVALVWEAFLGWIRVRGRRHELSLCQPSLAVDELWQQLSHDERTWRQMPEQVRAMNRIPVRDHGSRSALTRIYEEAYWDEFAGRLPLLFLVDEALGIADGRLYQAKCTVEDCKDQSDQGTDPEHGRTCLHDIPWAPTGSSAGGASS